MVPIASVWASAQFVRETASRLVESAPVDTRPVLAVIVHFPPEMAQLGPVATTVPTSGWRYVSQMGGSKVLRHKLHSTASSFPWVTSGHAVARHRSLHASVCVWVSATFPQVYADSFSADISQAAGASSAGAHTGSSSDAEGSAANDWMSDSDSDSDSDGSHYGAEEHKVCVVHGGTVDGLVVLCALARTSACVA
jgi:hypothetical protein